MDFVILLLPEVGLSTCRHWIQEMIPQESQSRQSMEPHYRLGYFGVVEVTTGVEVYSINVCTQFMAWSIAESAWYVSWLVMYWKSPDFFPNLKYTRWLVFLSYDSLIMTLWLDKAKHKITGTYCMFTCYVYAIGFADCPNYQDTTSCDPVALSKQAAILSWTIHVAPSSLFWS